MPRRIIQAEAVHCFYEKESPEYERFMTDKLRMLLTRRAGRLIGSLKQGVTGKRLSDSHSTVSKKALDSLGEKDTTSSTKYAWT